ncbi:MAG: hypothetical protein IKG47_00655 [Oscillospiraceae bacterium]|nr:hypothetical protein [Clostridiales bacterium]MBR3353856.1 hypothetical protein [Oscillospiraceae bacterium]
MTRKYWSSYSQLQKEDLIELLEKADGTINDLRRDNEALFKRNMQQTAEIVLYRRQIEALLESGKDGEDGKGKQTEDIRVRKRP